jgi:hypothetical protein
VTQSDVHRCREDRHENGIADLKLSDKSLSAKFVRVELVPQWGIKKFSDLSSWKFVVDQDILPDWWNAKEAELAVREAVEESSDYKKSTFGGYLDLRGLTTLAPGCLPKTAGGYLDLRGLTTLAPGCLPKTVGGYLDLSGLTTLAPGCLPKTVGGYLYLSSLTTLAPGCLPKTVGGYLYLSGCDLSGITLPANLRNKVIR